MARDSGTFSEQLPNTKGMPGEVLIQTDFPGHALYAEVAAQDYAAFKTLADQGRVQLHDVGVGLDPDILERVAEVPLPGSTAP